LAVARILTSPPPRALDLDLVEIVLRLLQLGLGVLRHFHDFVEAGMSGAFRWSKDSRWRREGVEHRADIWVRQHIGANALLGHFLLLLQRRLAAFVGEADLPAPAGDLLERGGEVARKSAPSGAAASAPARRREADQPDMVVQLEREQLLALRSTRFRPAPAKVAGRRRLWVPVGAARARGRRAHRPPPARHQRRRIGHVGGVDQPQQRHRRRLVRVGRDPTSSGP
jgi:hypothetical protein